MKQINIDITPLGNICNDVSSTFIIIILTVIISLFNFVLFYLFILLIYLGKSKK